MIGTVPVIPAYQRAALETNLGLIEPGVCNNCKHVGPRLKFYNEFADPPVEFDLCVRCMSTAIHCIGFHLLNTPTGKELLADWIAEQDADDEEEWEDEDDG